MIVGAVGQDGCTIIFYKLLAMFDLILYICALNKMTRLGRETFIHVPLISSEKHKKKKGKAELFSAHDKQRLCFSVSKTGKIVVDGLLGMVSSKGGVFSLEFENRFEPHFLKKFAEGIKASFGAQESADD